MDVSVIRTTSVGKRHLGVTGRLSFSASTHRVPTPRRPQSGLETGAISGCDVSTGIFTENNWFSCGSVNGAMTNGASLDGEVLASEADGTSDTIHPRRNRRGSPTGPSHGSGWVEATSPRGQNKSLHWYAPD